MTWLISISHCHQTLSVESFSRMTSNIFSTNSRMQFLSGLATLQYIFSSGFFIVRNLTSMRNKLHRNLFFHTCISQLYIFSTFNLTLIKNHLQKELLTLNCATFFNFTNRMIKPWCMSIKVTSMGNTILSSKKASSCQVAKLSIFFFLYWSSLSLLTMLPVSVKDDFQHPVVFLCILSDQ